MGGEGSEDKRGVLGQGEKVEHGGQRGRWGAAWPSKTYYQAYKPTSTLSVGQEIIMQTCMTYRPSELHAEATSQIWLFKNVVLYCLIKKCVLLCVCFDFFPEHPQSTLVSTFLKVRFFFFKSD